MISDDFDGATKALLAWKEGINDDAGVMEETVVVDAIVVDAIVVGVKTVDPRGAIGEKTVEEDMAEMGGIDGADEETGVIIFIALSRREKW